jgi:Recombination, repair and ssDNA binding protein UvsY
MENLDKIIEMWSSDAEMDMTEPSKELMKISQYHSKYLRILSKHKMMLEKVNFDYLNMRRLKWEYYTGKMDQDELDKHGWEQFQFALKSDIAYYIESDQDLIKILQKKVYHKECVSVCEAIMQELKSRTYQLKSYIDYERFLAGA